MSPSKPSMPAAPPPPPQHADVQRSNDVTRQARMRSRAGTIATSSQGVLTPASTTRKTALGQ